MAGPGGTAPLPQEFVEELSAFSAHGATVESLRSGFAVTPDSVPDELLRLILGKKARAARPPTKPKHGLTKAEKEICELYAKLGYSQKAVAAHRKCSASAVSQAIKSAKAKLPPDVWQRYYERRSKQYGKKVVGKRARMPSLPKDLAAREVYSQDLPED